MGLGEGNKFVENIGMILGISILAVGALILVSYYGYFDIDFVSEDIVTLAGGAGCVIGGLYLTIKEIVQKKKGF